VLENAEVRSDGANTQMNLSGLPQHQQNDQIIIPMTAPRANNPKRHAPSSEPIQQPNAKKVMPIQEDLSKNTQGNLGQHAMNVNQGVLMIQQGDTRVAPFYNPSLPLAHNAQLMNTALYSQNTSVTQGILGAAPGQHAPQSKATHNVRVKRRPSGWDIQAQHGLPTYRPGSNTWKRNVDAAKAREGPSTQRIPVSPCRSDASSAIAGAYDHDPWPLHTPAASHSQGTQDSKLGAFLPPQETKELYFTTNTHVVEPQGNMQANTELQNEASRTEDAGNAGSQLNKAQAPAFKAPRAP
jgi:hypothetical protein